MELDEIPCYEKNEQRANNTISNQRPAKSPRIRGQGVLHKEWASQRATGRLATLRVIKLWVGVHIAVGVWVLVGYGRIEEGGEEKEDVLCLEIAQTSKTLAGWRVKAVAFQGVIPQLERSPSYF